MRLPAPIEAGRVDEVAYGEVFEVLSSDELAHSSARIDEVSKFLTAQSVTVDEDGFCISHAELSIDVAEPEKIPRPHSAPWHSDNQRHLTIIISDNPSISTEVISGQVPMFMSFRMRRYQHSGFGAKKDYWRRVGEVLGEHTDQQLLSKGFRIDTLNPFTAYALTERHVHRSPVNRSLETQTRRFLKVYVDPAE